MRHDSRLSGVLHVLLHMARHPKPLTSEALARAMGTRAAVVRRTMAGLREGGLVKSEKGHHGGWTIAPALSGITLLDIYVALGRPGILALSHRDMSPGCLVEQAVNAALGSAFADAEALLLRHLAELNASLESSLAQREACTMETTHAA